MKRKKAVKKPATKSAAKKSKTSIDHKDSKSSETKKISAVASKAAAKGHMVTPIPKAEIENLIGLAFKAREESYSPYSSFQVGACLVTDEGKVYGGCNIENASYGGTVCAERVAIWKAVSEGASTPIQALCVVTNESEIWPPCGLCRQVMAEFCAPDTLIITANSVSNYKLYTFAELQPEAFTPAFLSK